MPAAPSLFHGPAPRDAPATLTPSHSRPQLLTTRPRKFGKTLARRQLDIPDYAPSFVNYKQLKKLIKSLSSGDVPTSHTLPGTPTDAQAALQANKATFFFRLERELEKVNSFYLQKEAELQLRLRALLEKKDAFQGRSGRFRQFEHDLSKLQQFVEINATAFSKILKKWDKSAKSRTKELYISRAVEVQPCFNREVISELSDQASSALLQLEAWADGENISFTQASTRDEEGTGERDTDVELLNAVRTNNTSIVEQWLGRLDNSKASQELATRVFLASIAEAPESALGLLLISQLVDFSARDEINERNCLHEAAIAGKESVLEVGLRDRVDVGHTDVYGRIPLHYAVIHGRIEMMRKLIAASPNTIDYVDHDNFTPLILAITHNRVHCVEELIKAGARIDPRNERDYIPLNLACQYGYEEVAKKLLERHAKILPDAEGLYPQHLVARSGRSIGLLNLLQQYGANINEADKFFQWTPIFHAASEGHVQCLETLLSIGAQVDAIDEKGLSALYYAAWEGHLDCMRLLSSSGSRLGVVGFNSYDPSPALSLGTAEPMQIDSDGIPDLSLPPPILPLRRYGHNFLENKTLVQLFFEEAGAEAIHLENESKYPAARLTISSKSSDLIPRNLILPLNEDSRFLSFQIDTLDAFAIDFDVYPTFGSRVVARTIALSDTFQKANSGHCILPLFDTRLRAIGRLSFDFRIIRPFQGVPLEITHFATYWKATSQIDQHSTTLITGSSLSGAYVRLHVRITADSVPILYPTECISIAGVSVPVKNIIYAEYAQEVDSAAVLRQLEHESSPKALQNILASSFLPLADVLSSLHPDVNVELNIRYPSKQSSEWTLVTHNVNHYVDAILRTVFDHARALKKKAQDLTRAIVFTSSDRDVCTAVNWKQPNYPVFFSNCAEVMDSAEVKSLSPVCSMKDAVRFASSNNLMGLICPSYLLDVVPALVQSVKSSGLVLVAQTESDARSKRKGVDGILADNAILEFEQTIEM